MGEKDKMQKALEADGEKLRQLTGEDHGPFEFDDFDDGECPQCFGEGRVAGTCIDGCCVDQDDPDCPYCSHVCDLCRQPKPATPGAPRT